ncbi:MAG TPA: AI-2E family transporter [Vicinamibacterales bacterium]|nr:AI-2E family transporter [Vicinamibacterales bacterium]
MYRFTLIIVAWAASALLLYGLGRVVFVLVVAMFFAYLIAPLVASAERPLRAVSIPRRLSRGVAIGLVYVAISGVTWAGAAMLLPTVSQQVSEVVSQAPGYAQSLRTWQAGWTRSYERLRLPAELRRRIDESLLDAGDRIVTRVRESVAAGIGILSYLPWIVLIPVLAFFMLKDAESLRQAALNALPQRFRGRGYRLFEELNATLAAYIRAQLLACVVVGAACGIGFAALGLPYAVLLGVLAGVLEFIPLVGPLAMAVIAGTIASLHAPMLAVWVTGFLAVVRVVEDYVVYPRLVGRGLRLHPLAVILAVLAGLELGGVAGIFLAIPVVAALSVAWRHGRGWLDEPPEPLRV